MSKEFVVVVANNRKLGELLLPYLIERKSGQSFFSLDYMITSENVDKLSIKLSEYEKQLVTVAAEYSEKVIHKVFGKAKNLKDFFAGLDEDYALQFIRPYIEKRILTGIEIVIKAKIPVYRKEKNYMVVHDDEIIKVAKEPVHSVFNFIKSDEGIRYYLFLQVQEKELKLFNQSYTFLSQKPCALVLGDTLYRVENIDSKKLLPFFSKAQIDVPIAREKEYMETFVKNAILNFPVKVTGFAIENVKANHTAHITLDYNLRYQPVLNLEFKYGEVGFRYGSLLHSTLILTESENKYVFYKYDRNSKWENEMVSRLKDLGFEHEEGSAFKRNTKSGSEESSLYDMVNWLNFNYTELTEQGFILNKSKFDKDYFLETINLSVDVKEENDWFDFHALVKIGNYSFPFSRFRKHIIMGIKEFTLPDNQIVILPEEWFSRYREIFIFGDEQEERLKLRKHHFQIVQEALGPETGRMLLDLADKFKLVLSEDDKEPEGFNGKLREYQKIGVHWLYQLYSNRFGGCLADDMGLGKTLQAIALLLKIKSENVYNSKQAPGQSNIQLSLFDIPEFTGGKVLSTSLIVMPVSLIHNWENEILKFAPSLKVYKFFGTQRTRNFDDLLNVDVVLTSYGVVRNDILSLCKLKFKYIILDESQIIKNPDSKIYKSVIQLESEYKLVLTGTPIENSLIDLWTQLNFLNRDMLKSQHYFREEFVTPIEKHNIEEKKLKLQMIINPFILRRKKEEVIKELPSLTEQVIYCEMTEEQGKIYESVKSSIRNMIFESIESKGFEKSSILILKALNKLRLLANHPVLTEYDYKGESGKFEEIIRSIENVVEEQHKVLIFSSYVKHLNLVADYLKGRNWEYNMLTGASINRQKIIDSFQKEEGSRIFLISLKAGGVGLNLTAADYVFILDPWWNPAAENQAISRAHRIGQEKKVFVYRFLSRGTIEEKIQILQNRKSAMAELFVNNNNPFRSFKKEEVEEFFK